MTWLQDHRSDIVFITSIMVGAALVIAGIWADNTSTIMLGAGAIGIKGFMEVTQ